MKRTPLGLLAALVALPIAAFVLYDVTQFQPDRAEINALLVQAAQGPCESETHQELMARWSIIDTEGGVRISVPAPGAIVHTVSANCKVTAFDVALVRSTEGTLTPTHIPGLGGIYVHFESRKGGYGENGFRCGVRPPPFVDLHEIGARACLPTRQTFLSPQDFQSALSTGSPVPAGLEYEFLAGPGGLRDYASVGCSVVAGMFTPSSLARVRLRVDADHLCRIYWNWRPEVTTLVDINGLARNGDFPLSDVRPLLVSLQGTLDSWIVSKP